MNIFKKLGLLVTGLFCQFQVMAQEAIPFAESMSDDADGTDVWTWITGQASNAFTLIFFGIGLITFSIVAYNIIMNVIEWRKGKLELGELGQQSIGQVGVMVAVFVVLGFANAFAAG